MAASPPREPRARPCIPGAPARAAPGVARRSPLLRLHAAASDAWPRTRMARSRRPPNRPRGRPRAEGTSGCATERRARAARVQMSSLKGTCVRKLRTVSDGLPSPPSGAPGIAGDPALQSHFPAQVLQRSLHRRVTGAPARGPPPRRVATGVRARPWRRWRATCAATPPQPTDGAPSPACRAPRGPAISRVAGA